MATVGNLKVDLGLDSAAFDVGIKSAGKGMDTLAKRAAVMGAAIAAAVTAAAGAFTAIVLKTSEAAKATGDMADMLGLNVESLQELRHAADRGGMGMQNFDVAMRRFIRRSAEAANGTGAAKGAFKELGIELRTTDGRLKDSEALLAEVADAMEGVQSPADKLRLAFQMFDTDGAKMVNVLAGGSEELERLREEARKLGIVLDEDTIRAAQRFQDNLDTLRKGGEALANRLTAAALPAFVAVTNAMINFSAHTGDVIGAMVNVARYAGVAVAGIAGFFAPAILAGLGAVSVAIGTTMVAAVRALTAAMLANPLGLLIAGITAAVAAAFIFRDEIKQVIGIDVIDAVKTAANRIIGLFEAAYNAVVTLWQHLPEVFSGVGKRAWNSFIEEFEKPALTINGMTIIPGFDLTGWKAKETEAEVNALSATVASFNDTLNLNKDYLGDFAAGIGEAWSNATGATGALNELGGALNDSLGGSSGAGSGKENAFQRATKAIRDNIEALKIQAATFGMSEAAATRFTTTMNLLRAAEEAKMTITPVLRQQIDALAGAFANAEENARNLEKVQQTIAAVNSKLADSFTDMFMSAFEGGKDLLDIVGSLLRDLGRMFIHQGFQALLGMGGGGGGLFGGLFSGLGSIPGFARGGTIMPGGAGGIDSQLVMFRKSPNERVDITKPGQTLTSGDGGPSELNFNITVSGARGNAEIRQMVEQGMDSALQTVRQHLPDWVANPRVKFV